MLGGTGQEFRRLFGSKARQGQKFPGVRNAAGPLVAWTGPMEKAGQESGPFSHRGKEQQPMHQKPKNYSDDLLLHAMLPEPQNAGAFSLVACARSEIFLQR